MGFGMWFSQVFSEIPLYQDLENSNDIVDSVVGGSRLVAHVVLSYHSNYAPSNQCILASFNKMLLHFLCDRPPSGEIVANVSQAVANEYQVEDTTLGRALKVVVESMWHQDPLQRPTFNAVVRDSFSVLQRDWAKQKN